MVVTLFYLFFSTVILVEGLKCLSSFEKPHHQLVAVQEILMLAWTQVTR